MALKPKKIDSRMRVGELLFNFEPLKYNGFKNYQYTSVLNSARFKLERKEVQKSPRGYNVKIVNNPCNKLSSICYHLITLKRTGIEDTHRLI